MTSALVLLALFMSLPLFAQTDSLIPRSLFFSEPIVRSVQLSPDGERLGYLTSSGGSTQLHIRSSSDGWKEIVVADTGAIVAWQWTYRKEKAIIISQHSAGDRLHTLNIADGSRHDITPSGALRLAVLALSHRHPDRAVVLMEAEGEERTGLYEIDLRDASRITRIADPEPMQFYFDTDLRLRAARRQTRSGSELMRRTDDAGWEPIARFEGMQEYQVPGVIALAADGKEIIIVDNRNRDKGALVAIDLGSGAEREVIADPLADLIPAGATIDSAGRVQSVVSYFPDMRRHFLDSSIIDDFVHLQAIHAGDISFAGQSLDGMTWLIRYLDGGPLDYYIYDRRGKRAQFLFNELPALADHRLASRHAHLVASRDGLQLPCDIFLPSGSDTDGNGIPDRPLPTLVYVHGGPWVGFQRNLWLTNRHFQLLADRGYAVIRADFRGTMGYGREFMAAGDRQWGEGMMHDILDITSWAVAEGIADNDRLGIWGWSYGGYAAFAALAFWPDVYACGVSMYGVSDLVDAVGSRVERDGAEAWSEWLQRVGDVTTSEGRALLLAQSPLSSVERITKPLLVTHGALDRIVEQRQSDTIVHRLRELDRPVTYFIYPDEGHDYRRAENWESFWAIAERFLHEHLGGRYEQYGRDIAESTMRILTGAERVPGLAQTIREVN